MADITLYENGVYNCCIVAVGASNSHNLDTQNGQMRALRLLVRCFKKATISDATPNGDTIVWGNTNPGNYAHVIYLTAYEDTNEPLGKIRCYTSGADIYIEYRASADTWSQVWAVARFCELLFDAKMLWPGYYGTVVYPQNPIVLTDAMQNWEWGHPLEHLHFGNIISDSNREFTLWHGGEETTVASPTSRKPLDQASYEKNWTSPALPVKKNAVSGVSTEIPEHPCAKPYGISKRFPHLAGIFTDGVAKANPGNTVKPNIVTQFAHNPLFNRYEAPRPSGTSLRDPEYATSGHQNEGRIIPSPSLEQVWFYDWLHRDRSWELLDEYQWTKGTGWSGDFSVREKSPGVYSADGFTHAASGVVGLLSKSILVKAGDVFSLSFTTANSGGIFAGSVTVSIKDLSVISGAVTTIPIPGGTISTAGTFTFSGLEALANATTFIVFTPTEDFLGTIKSISLRKTNLNHEARCTIFPIDGGNYSTNMHPMPAIYDIGGRFSSAQNRESFRKAVYYAAAPDPAFQSPEFNASIARMNLGEIPNALTYTFTRQYILFYKRLEAYFDYQAENHPDAVVRARAAACRFSIYIYHRYSAFPVGLNVDLGRFDAYVTGNDRYSQVTIRNLSEWGSTNINLYWRNNIFYSFPIAPYHKHNTDCEIWEALRVPPFNSKRTYIDGYIAFTVHGVQPLYFYTVARMFRQPGVSSEEIQEEFYNCFGPAREVVRRYFEKAIEISQAGPLIDLIGTETRRSMSASIRLWNHETLSQLTPLLPALDALAEADFMSDEEKDRYMFVYEGLRIAIMAYRVYSPVLTSGSPWEKITTAGFRAAVNETLLLFPKDTNLKKGFGDYTKILNAAGIVSAPSSVPVGYYEIAVIYITYMGDTGDTAELFGNDSVQGGIVSFQTGPSSVLSTMVDPSEFLEELAIGASNSIGAKWSPTANPNTVPYTVSVVRDDEDKVIAAFLLGSVKARPIKGTFAVNVTGGNALTVEERFLRINANIPGSVDPIVNKGGTIELSTPDGATFNSGTTAFLANLSGTQTYALTVQQPIVNPDVLVCTVPLTSPNIPSGNAYSIKVIIPNADPNVRPTLGVSVINVMVT